MASNTQQTEYRRALRRKNAGKARKAALRSRGTTPPFAIHTPEAVENAAEAASNAATETPTQAG